MASKENSKLIHVDHGFGPYYDADSEILILGSFPSVKSRELEFFYGHPMNRFWRVLGDIYGRSFDVSVDKKKEILKDVHIALYDVIESCDIVGSSDASIKNPIVSDLLPILRGTKVRLIVLNGKKAGDLFERFQIPLIGNDIPHIVLPSTSPANAATSLQKLTEIWKEALIRACAH